MRISPSSQNGPAEKKEMRLNNHKQIQNNNKEHTLTAK